MLLILGAVLAVVMVAAVIASDIVEIRAHRREERARQERLRALDAETAWLRDEQGEHSIIR